MSDTKITEGPWFYGYAAGESVDPDNQQWSIGIGEVDSDGNAMGCRGDEYMLVSGICEEGDARVMAASRDLLQALIDAVNNPDDSAYWIHQAKNAISKAGGDYDETAGPDSPGHLLP